MWLRNNNCKLEPLNYLLFYECDYVGRMTLRNCDVINVSALKLPSFQVVCYTILGSQCSTDTFEAILLVDGNISDDFGT